MAQHKSVRELAGALAEVKRSVGDAMHPKREFEVRNAYPCGCTAVVCRCGCENPPEIRECRTHARAEAMKELLKELALPASVIVETGGVDSKYICGICEAEAYVDSKGVERGHEPDCLVLRVRALFKNKAKYILK